MRPATLVLCLAGCLAALPGSAAAQDGSRQTASLAFTETKAGTVTGLELRIDYVNPGDPASKPPAVRRVVTELADGARYDTGAPALCTASDPELMAQGAAACSPQSVVGTGILTLDTGVPGPGRYIVTDTTFLNNTDELIFLNVERQSGGNVVVRGAVTERTIVSEAPFLPGSPPDGTAIDTVEITDFPISTPDGRNYITTPPDCPQVGYWVNRVHFTYYDGITQVVETRSECKDGKQNADGRLRLKVRPRHVVAGKPVQFRFRVRGSDACRAGAMIRFAGESMDPDANGRARLVRALRNPGLRRPRVSSPGCDSARARVRVHE